MHLIVDTHDKINQHELLINELLLTEFIFTSKKIMSFLTLNFVSSEFLPRTVAHGGAIRRSVNVHTTFILRIFKLVCPWNSYGSFLNRTWNDRLDEKTACMLNRVIIDSFSVRNTPRANEWDTAAAP